MLRKIDLVLILLVFPVVIFASSIVWADEYVLVMSKDDNVCQHMLGLYNEDLRKYGEIKYDQHKEFIAIKWEKQKSYFESYEAKGLKEHDTLISKFDINNDGKPEIIIKDEHRTVRGIDADGLYIFRENDFNDFKDKVVINQDFADKAVGAWGYVFNKKPFRANVYRLNELSTKYYLGGWFYFHTFFYKGKYFTSMNDRLPDTAEKWRAPEYEENKWEVVFQFTPESQLKDVCYFLKVSNCKNINKGGK